jgi:hypothetical protein
MTARTVFRFVAVLALAVTAGCGPSLPPDYTEFEDLHPVTGQVLFRGQPIPDATIRLHPVTPASAGSPAAVMSSVVNEDGGFEVFTFRAEGKGKGAPVGEYLLTVSWSGPRQGLTNEQQDQLTEKLPAKYTRPQTSQLSLKVMPGENRVDAISIQ